MIRKSRNPIDNKSYTTGIKDYKQWKNSKTPGANATITQVHKDRHLDKQNYKKLKKVLKNQDYFPNTLAEYRKIRYNNVEEYDKLNRSFNTLKNIKLKNWTKSFKAKAISEYHNFRKHCVEVSDHFLSKYINLKGKNGITEDLVITLFKIILQII